MDRLIFAVLADTMAELRRVPSRCGSETPVCVEVLRAHFTVWERGVLLNAAAFLIDFPQLSVELPLGAVSIAHRVVEAESRNGFFSELIAASVAAIPWRSRFDPACLQCSRTGTWRPILEGPGMPAEMAWRYERPENHIPLCRRCVSRMALRRWEQRFEIARALWGGRFGALLRWHHAVENGVLPVRWRREEHPLWPQEFGGASWQTGSGALSVSEPKPYYGVFRTRADRECLERYLGERRAAEIGRQRERARTGETALPPETAAFETVGRELR